MTDKPKTKKQEKAEERARAQNRERQKRFRERQKLEKLEGQAKEVALTAKKQAQLSKMLTQLEEGKLTPETRRKVRDYYSDTIRLDPRVEEVVEMVFEAATSKGGKDSESGFSAQEIIHARKVVLDSVGLNAESMAEKSANTAISINITGITPDSGTTIDGEVQRVDAQPHVSISSTGD